MKWHAITKGIPEESGDPFQDTYLGSRKIQEIAKKNQIQSYTFLKVQ